MSKKYTLSLGQADSGEFQAIGTLDDPLVLAPLVDPKQRADFVHKWKAEALKQRDIADVVKLVDSQTRLVAFFSRIFGWT